MTATLHIPKRPKRQGSSPAPGNRERRAGPTTSDRNEAASAARLSPPKSGGPAWFLHDSPGGWCCDYLPPPSSLRCCLSGRKPPPQTSSRKRSTQLTSARVRPAGRLYSPATFPDSLREARSSLGGLNSSFGGARPTAAQRMA